mmetsp:Transcript_11476/g.30367  ORF Transcript_11476/g.30367 Transcript_11476/m.30367 type:complete len:234 (-) Transcript_11476:382-1083(-)
MGSPACCRCARIWCVRPVTGCTWTRNVPSANVIGLPSPPFQGRTRVCAVHSWRALPVASAESAASCVSRAMVRSALGSCASGAVTSNQRVSWRWDNLGMFNVGTSPRRTPESVAVDDVLPSIQSARLCGVPRTRAMYSLRTAPFWMSAVSAHAVTLLRANRSTPETCLSRRCTGYSAPMPGFSDDKRTSAVFRRYCPAACTGTEAGLQAATTSSRTAIRRTGVSRDGGSCRWT